MRKFLLVLIAMFSIATAFAFTPPDNGMQLYTVSVLRDINGQRVVEIITNKGLASGDSQICEAAGQVGSCQVSLHLNASWGIINLVGTFEGQINVVAIDPIHTALEVTVASFPIRGTLDLTLALQSGIVNIPEASINIPGKGKIKATGKIQSDEFVLGQPANKSIYNFSN